MRARISTIASLAALHAIIVDAIVVHGTDDSNIHTATVDTIAASDTTAASKETRTLSPVTANSLDLSLDWPGILTPKPTSVAKATALSETRTLPPVTANPPDTSLHWPDLFTPKSTSVVSKPTPTPAVETSTSTGTHTTTSQPPDLSLDWPDIFKPKSTPYWPDIKGGPFAQRGPYAVTSHRFRGCHIPSRRGYETIYSGAYCHHLHWPLRSLKFMTPLNQLPIGCTLQTFMRDDCSGLPSMSIDGLTNEEACYQPPGLKNTGDLIKSIKLVCIEDYQLPDRPTWWRSEKEEGGKTMAAGKAGGEGAEVTGAMTSMGLHTVAASTLVMMATMSNDTATASAKSASADKMTRLRLP